MTGRYVRSCAGRGKGRIFVITEVIDERYVLISDGRTRKQANPKKKKLMHVELLGGTAKLPCTDKELWRQIKSDFDLS